MKRAIIANPDPAMISTSHIERSNLTMRTQIKRLARLTLSFSKRWENLWYAIALHFAYYNFCRIHSSLSGNACDGIESNGSRLDDWGTPELERDPKITAIRRDTSTPEISCKASSTG
jgi:hypothetical protein